MRLSGEARHGRQVCKQRTFNSPIRSVGDTCLTMTILARQLLCSIGGSQRNTEPHAWPELVTLLDVMNGISLVEVARRGNTRLGRGKRV